MKLLSAPASPFGRKVKIVAIEKGMMDTIEYVAMATAPSAPARRWRATTRSSRFHAGPR